MTTKNRNIFLLYTETVASRAHTAEQQPAASVQTCTQFLAPSKCTSRCHDVRAHPLPPPYPGMSVAGSGARRVAN